MEQGVNWLELAVLVTVILLTTFAIVGADFLHSYSAADDKSGKLTLTIEKPQATIESGNYLAKSENG